MAKQDNTQALFDVIYEQGPMSGQDLKARTGMTKEEILPVVQQGLAGGWLIKGEDNLFYVVVEGQTVTEAQGTEADAAAAQAEDEFDGGEPEIVYEDEFAQAPPTRAAAPAARKAAPAPAATKQAPAKRAAAQAPAADQGFTMSYKTMDKLTAEELAERIDIAVAAAEANYATGEYDNQIVAELLMRWVARANRRLRSMQGGE
jgi:hypothetical protein